MAYTDNIFSGLKVVDLASFIAGPGAATILSDFGADVIKVEPPGTGDPHRHTYKIPPLPSSPDNYAWHLDNRNKRGMALDLKSPHATDVMERLVKWADVLIINYPQPVRKRLKLTYDDVAAWNPRLIYADISGFGDAGPDAHLPGFDITAYWARSGLLALTRDAGAPPTLPVSGSGDHATAVGLYGAIVTGLYRRERTGKGAYVTTSLIAEGVWSSAVSVQAALNGATFYPLHDRTNPPNAVFNVYRASDDKWFLIVVQDKDWPALATGVGRADLLLDARFQDEATRGANAAALTAILDGVFSAEPWAHWRDALDRAHITYGVVQDPSDILTDPQLLLNNIIVPLEGAGDRLTRTISSPLQIHDVAKVPARRAPELGEHNDELLEELGFTADDIDGLRASGVIPHAWHLTAVAPGGGK
ncbi:MAG TPA: CoA transferase [Gemmatimonadaceae bacterium]|jgi:crotonobetainyl-CoA:carnitine CoA-transferase CaiB-like acyl-CoA transferase|nr:CoA transferase [Gemmatimonadaceae bacterium]